MTRQERRRVSVSDDAIRRALRPGPDLAAPADFALTVGRAIADRPQRRAGRQLGAGPWSRQLRLAGQLVLVIALLLALLIGALIAGSPRQRPLGGGPLFVAQATVLTRIDPETGASTPVIDDPRGIFGVARSTSGGLVSFWTGTAGRPGTILEVARADGSDRRPLATNLEPDVAGVGGIDVWSPDNRFLAAGVRAGGVSRILVVDIVSGEGHLIGPDDGAGNPLWSPDGEWLAFTREKSGRPSVLALMRPDGSDVRELTGDLDAYVSGPDNWSSDGAWIYFDAGGAGTNIYRAEVATGRVEPLTRGGSTAAPALSPDDSAIAYMAWTQTGAPAVWIMHADGSAPRLLAQGGDLRGWSPDGRYVLVVMRSVDAPVQLLAITPDGAEQRVFLSLDTCPNPCLESLSWGWPRP